MGAGDGGGGDLGCGRGHGPSRAEQPGSKIPVPSAGWHLRAVYIYGDIYRYVSIGIGDVATQPAGFARRRLAVERPVKFGRWVWGCPPD